MIHFDNVTKMYPNQSRPALESVNLDVEKGEFVFLVGLSSATAVSRAPLGVVRSDPDLRWLFEQAMRETWRVGRARGVALADDYVEQRMAFADGLQRAFLVGALFASSEYRHALEGDIEPFKGLLLGLFFIAIGMSIDVRLVGAQPGMLALLVSTILVAKGAALALMARRLGVAARERWLFAALLAQGGEFAFVVLKVPNVKSGR